VKKILLVIGFVSILFACKSPKEEMIAQITKLENSDSTYSINNITDLYNNYSLFADRYPDDERTPEFLFKAAQQSNVINKSKEGIALLNKIISNYPNSNFSEKALFAIAFSYENNLNDYENAKKSYESFLQKYPKSELKDDAQLSMDNLGKTDEEFLKDIENSEEED